jgi:hypothetical protein
MSKWWRGSVWTFFLIRAGSRSILPPFDVLLFGRVAESLVLFEE